MRRTDTRTPNTTPLPAAIQLPWWPGNWDPWMPHQLAAKLADIDARWCVVGGWALDLFTGVVHREHEDLEIIVPRDSFPLIRQRLEPELTFYVSGAEGQWPVDTAGTAYDKYQQTFGRDESTGKFVLDVMRVADTGVWELANHPEIVRPWSESIEFTGAGVPYLRPEQVLIYKALGINDAEEPRLKDSNDFLYVLPYLEPGGRAWLEHTLALLRPEHPWLRTLDLVTTG
ncbi:nucleotidyltransferase domain-containing protein [Microlunatus soli]|uniref:Aminoglycoside-2''-adenylyltransferase n=1 Tax=Microlunatus soli TaxID=630515 RepID=A0A1H1T4P2_9ACTN|nr:hypothetical protein [Microlunatus soli]SDS54986.1 hypothetical protein SAMN04489812_2246 [Microlunatus soli]